MKRYRAGSKDLRDVQRRFRSGYQLVSDGKAKFVVVGPDGPVKMKDGSGRNLSLPNSPHPSSIPEHIRRLESHGVLVGGDEPKYPSTPRTKLVRTDTAEWNDDNTVATAALRQRLRDLKIWGLLERHQSSVVPVLRFVGDVDEETAAQLIYRVLDGWTLVPSDRKAFERLVERFQEEDDPVASLFNLLREIRGLPSRTHLQPQPVPQPEEVTVTTVEAPSFMETAESFMDTLRSRRDTLLEQIGQLQEEVQKIESFISIFPEMMQMMGAPQGVAAPAHRSTEIDLSDVSSREEETGDQRDARFTAEKTRQRILEVLQQGGEWTQVELADELDVQQSTVSSHLRRLVDEGQVVIVTTGTGGPGGASTYGVASIYEKS